MNELMNNIVFEDKNIKIVGDYENPWFCGKDVCGILGYQDHKRALYDHVDKEDKKSLYEITKTNGIGISSLPKLIHNELQTCYINENGLYDLILKSKMPNAKKFKKWITKEVLPSIRKTGQYKENQEVSKLKKYFEDKLALKEEEIQQNKEEIQQNKDYITILKDISIHDTKREFTEVIYIATSENYARRNRFKIGGVQSCNKLQSRLSTYNTRSANGDMFYFSDIFMVADYRHAESRVKDLIGRFVDKKGKEFYQLHYNELKEIIKYICERYTDEVSTINDGLERLIASLNIRVLRSVIPRPINHAMFTTITNGIAENIIITGNENIFRDKIRSYLDNIVYPIDILKRKDFFEAIPIKVNKHKGWGWIKQEIGNYNPQLLNYLQYN